LLGTSTIAVAIASALPTPSHAQTNLPPVVVEGASRAMRPAPSGSAAPATPPAAAAQPSDPGPSESSDVTSGGSVDPGDLVTNQGTAVTVISGEELRQLQVHYPAEALRSQPGVTVGRTGAFGGLTQVGIRGMFGRHTLVLIDGIEANNPGDGEFDFSNLIAGDEIERVEVLRGPQSGLYGSGAMGGVINIVSRSGKGPLTLTSRAEVGSFNSKDAAAVLSAGGDKAWGLMGIQTLRTDGFNISPFGSEKDGTATTSSIVRAGIQPIQGLTIEGVLRQTKKVADRDGENYEIPGVLIQQTDTPSRFSSDLWLGSLEAKLSLFGGAWVQSIRGDGRSIANDDRDINPSFVAFAPNGFFERYRANAETYRYTSTVRLDTPGVPDTRHFVTGLVEQKHEGFIQYTDDGLDHERTIRSYVGEVRGEYWNNLFLAGSIRRDETNTSGDYTTWRTSGSLRLPGTPVRLHSSYGTGVKLPSLFELYGRAPLLFSPNPNLKPETSKGWDAGIEFTLAEGRAIVDFTWFDVTLTDRIRSAFTGLTSTSINVPGTSTRQGLEVSGTLVPLPGLTIRASYTWLDAQEPNGIRELRRPLNTARLDAAYTFDRERAKIGMSLIYNGSMIDEALRTSGPPCFFGCFPLTPERVTLKDYVLLAATASYKLTPTVEIYGRAENILDERYQEVYGFQAAGAAVFAGLRLKLQETRVAGDLKP